MGFVNFFFCTNLSSCAIMMIIIKKLARQDFFFCCSIYLIIDSVCLKISCHTHYKIDTRQVTYERKKYPGTFDQSMMIVAYDFLQVVNLQFDNYSEVKYCLFSLISLYLSISRYLNVCAYKCDWMIQLLNQSLITLQINK